MAEEKGKGLLGVDTPRKGFFWLLMAIGLILMAYFAVNMVFNAIYAVDLAGKGVAVVLKEAEYDQQGQMVKEPEITTLHGVSGWVESFAPWLATSAYILALGAIFFALGYVCTRRREEKLAVSLYKMRLLGGCLAAVALLMVVLGCDRVFFIQHGGRESVLDWTNWYILEFLAHIVWALVLGVLSLFYLRVQRVGDAAKAEGGLRGPEQPGD